MAPRVGFEPTTARLTVESSTAELSRSVGRQVVCVHKGFAHFNPFCMHLYAKVLGGGSAQAVIDGDTDGLHGNGHGGNGAVAARIQRTQMRKQIGGGFDQITGFT